MGIPTKEELEHALTMAGKMREMDIDPDFIAKCLLNTHYRMELLEKVFIQTKVYLNSGESTQEHAKLVKAIEAAEKAASVSQDGKDLGI